jgi:hypothetical protein
MEPYAALAILRSTPTAGDLAFSALPNAPILPVREPSTFRFRSFVRRFDGLALRRNRVTVCTAVMS